MYIWRFRLLSAASIENFINACHLDFLMCRRSVYFLNKCFIRVFYRFNRSRALQYQSYLWGFSYPNMMIQLNPYSRRNSEHYDELLS